MGLGRMGLVFVFQNRKFKSRLLLVTIIILMITLGVWFSSKSFHIYKYLNIASNEPYKSDERVGGFSTNGVWYSSSSFHTRNVTACRYPKLSPWDKRLPKLLKPPNLTCKVATRNWVEVIDGRFLIMPNAVQRYGNIACKIRPFKRVNDYVTTEGAGIPIDNNTLIPTDFFRVKCTASGGMTYTNIHAGITRHQHLLLKKTKVKSGLGLNVLIIAFDSVSRIKFMRSMPKTFKYLTDVLGAITLNGYNIVGDGTTKALIPMLTGKTEEELPRPLKRLYNDLTADVLPLAWKNFSRMGYVTLWAEDEAHIGAFTFRMTGFKEKPTDYYMRPFQVIVKKEMGEHSPLCLGDRSRYSVVLNWMEEFMITYRNNAKFAFMFLSELTHIEDNEKDNFQTSDKDVMGTLQSLKKQGLLNNTLLIVMSDHGSRTSKNRHTLPGKQQERNPFFSFTFPEWFKEKYPRAFKNVQTNSELLTTPFDIHSTLMDMLDFQGTGMGDKTKRSISLFQEIPVDRTCHDAHVEPHWCNCLEWKPLLANDPSTLEAAKELVKHINELTYHKRSICAELTLNEIRDSAVFRSSSAMLAFEISDADNSIPQLSDKTKYSDLIELIRLTISTEPSKAVYESTVTHYVHQNKIEINTDEISRINLYGKDAHCIMETDLSLRKFCFCKGRLKS